MIKRSKNPNTYLKEERLEKVIKIPGYLERKTFEKERIYRDSTTFIYLLYFVYL